MKLLLDFFPIVFFFIAYKFAGIYIATATAILIACLQVIYTYIKTRHIDSMQMLTLVLLIVLGGATLWFHNEMFIKWKPSIINWILSIIFIGSECFGQKPFIQQLMLKAEIDLPAQIWQRLNRAWAGFFMAMGCINLYIIYHFNTDIWVNFKLFGMLGLTLLFVICQSVYLAKHISKI